MMIQIIVPAGGGGVQLSPVGPSVSLDNDRQCLVLVSPDGQILDASVEASRRWNMSPDGIGALELSDLLEVSAPVDLKLVLAEAVVGGVVFAASRRLPDGTAVQLSVRLVPVQVAGRPALLGWIDDVVASRSEWPIEAAPEPGLRETLEALLNPHVVLEPVRDDAGGIVDFVHVEANEAACLYNRCTREELIGTRLLAMSLMPASRGERTVEVLAQVLAEGAPLDRSDVPTSLDRADDGLSRYLEFHAARLGGSLLFSWQDVSLAHHLSAKLAASEQHYRLLAENVSDVVVKVGLDGTYTWASPSLTDMLGWAPEEWIGRPTSDMTHPEDLEKFAGERSALVAGELRVDHGAWIGRYRAPAKDGTWHWIETHTSLAHDDEGRPDGAVVSFRVIDREVEREHQLERRARFDDLTGALKREGAMDRLGDMSAQSREPGMASAVLFIDIDGFKEVNDTWGHVAGDAILRTLSSRLRGQVRGNDTVARIGGDEFLVILDGLHDLSEATDMAERMRRVASDPIPIPGGLASVTISIGVTLLASGENVDAVVNRSDEAMYAAKRGGRNRVVVVPAGDVT